MNFDEQGNVTTTGGYKRNLAYQQEQGGIASRKAEREAMMAQSPEWYSVLQGDKRELPEEFQTQYTYDPTAQQEIQRRALSKDPSEWYNRMIGQQGLEEKSALDQASRQQQTGLASAQSQLAMRGGLRGGAAERLAGSGMRNLMQARQGVTGAGAQARQQLGLSDEEMKIRMLQSVPGMELARSGMEADIQGQNIQTRLGQIQQQNQAKQMAYQTKMQGWAAGQQAEATRATKDEGKD